LFESDSPASAARTPATPARCRLWLLRSSP